MSPRPGRIVQHLKVDFCLQPEGRNIRTIKSSAEFVSAREQVLSLIWGMEE
jgi:taurine transport system ATP-binding protein